MKIHTKIALFCALSTTSLPSMALVSNSEGTTREQLQHETLLAPSATRVAVLPFAVSTLDADAKRITTLFCHQFFARESFQVLAPTAGFEAVAADTQLEAGQPMKREDALRLGVALKADWIVWGEVREAAEYLKPGTFGDSQRIRFAVLLNVTDVARAKTIYSQAVAVDVGDRGKQRGKSKHQRLLFAGAAESVTNALQVLAAALPPHPQHNAATEQKPFFALYDQTWPK